MLGEAGQSPASRSIADVASRSERLAAFEEWRVPARVDFEALLGREAFDGYWRELDRIIEEMERSQLMANDLRTRIAALADRWQLRPMLAEPGSDPTACSSD